MTHYKWRDKIFQLAWPLASPLAPWMWLVIICVVQVTTCLIARDGDLLLFMWLTLIIHLQLTECGVPAAICLLHINYLLPALSGWKLNGEGRQFPFGVDWQVLWGFFALFSAICPLLTALLEMNKEDWRGVKWNSFLPRQIISKKLMGMTHEINWCSVNYF